MNTFTSIMVLPETQRKLKELAFKKRIKIYEAVEELVSFKVSTSPQIDYTLQNALVEKTEKVVMQNVDFNKVGEVIKKVKKSETCPHMISVGGVCNSCGGLAK